MASTAATTPGYTVTIRSWLARLYSRYVAISASSMPGSSPHSANCTDERRPDAAEPVFVGPRREAVRGERVMVAVEDQPDGIDERAIEIEQKGLEVGHVAET